MVGTAYFDLHNAAARLGVLQKRQGVWNKHQSIERRRGDYTGRVLNFV